MPLLNQRKTYLWRTLKLLAFSPKGPGLQRCTLGVSSSTNKFKLLLRVSWIPLSFLLVTLIGRDPVLPLDCNQSLPSLIVRVPWMNDLVREMRLRSRFGPLLDTAFITSLAGVRFLIFVWKNSGYAGRQVLSICSPTNLFLKLASAQKCPHYDQLNTCWHRCNLKTQTGMPSEPPVVKKRLAAFATALRVLQWLTFQLQTSCSLCFVHLARSNV